MSLLQHLQNVAAWVVIVVAVSTVLGAIWVLVDTFITYRIGAKVVTPPPAALPVVPHIRVHSFREPAIKGFKAQPRTATIISFRVH